MENIHDSVARDLPQKLSLATFFEPIAPPKRRHIGCANLRKYERRNNAKSAQTQCRLSAQSTHNQHIFALKLGSQLPISSGNAPKPRAAFKQGPGRRIFMIPFQELMMTNEASQKWAASSREAKAVLRIAFFQALARPELTADYAEWKIEIPKTTVTFFKFRIGYATFMLMIMDKLDEYIVIDFDLQDEDTAYVDQHVAAREMLVP
jgi:hypothetical protein